MNPKKVHCFFEQSGTFKNEFLKLGIPAEDYDILNDFGKTDHVTDLFGEIEKAYRGGYSVFDEISQDDLIIAFFPCVRFESSILLSFRGQQHQISAWTTEEKIKYCMKLQEELTEMYKLVSELYIVCIRKSLKLIIENPFSEEHYLRRYWCIPSTIIDRDRRERGDYYKKPTQYWFLNCQPENNILIENAEYNAIEFNKADQIRWITGKQFEMATGIKATQKQARSMIHPQYANRFIREFILDGGE